MAIRLHRYQDFTYIRLSDLSESERDEFLEWLYGATTPIIPTLDVQDAVYLWDYERWKEGKRTSQEGIVNLSSKRL